jgi:hypothetical protein
MELLNMGVIVGAEMSAGTANDEISMAKGHYDIECHDAEGNLLWSDGFDNLVPFAGKNQIVVSGAVAGGGSFLGLISASGFVAPGPTVNDTMTSHPNWLEATTTVAPVYGPTRPALTFGLPVSGVISNTASPATFVFDGASGTVNGGFAVGGTGATDVEGATTGVLVSAGTLTTPQPVISGNTITMTYTLTLN